MIVRTLDTDVDMRPDRTALVPRHLLACWLIPSPMKMLLQN
jgi:hypothetical protein